MLSFRHRHYFVRNLRRICIRTTRHLGYGTLTEFGGSKFFVIGKIFLFAALACPSLLAQSMDGLREKYGPPISETFLVHDGIGVTVKHGSDGSIREMLIIPVRSESLAPSRNMTFTNEQAKRILDELLPTSKRGKFIIGGFVDGICMPENDCGGSSENYENVSIYYNSSSQRGRLCYIEVQFKK